MGSGKWPCAQMLDGKMLLLLTQDYQFRGMPFGLCNVPAMFERLMDRVLSGMRWSRCLVYLDDVISFGTDVPEAML